MEENMVCYLGLGTRQGFTHPLGGWNTSAMGQGTKAFVIFWEL